MNPLCKVGIGLALCAAIVPRSHAVLLTLPDTSQTTVLTATVSEQADVTVPAGVTFSVTNIASATAASAASVSVSNVQLSTATKQLKVSVKADAASFTAPADSGAGAVTWSASDVSWNAAAWTNATGSSGTLSSSVFNTVATGTAGVTSMSTTGLVFTLAGKSTVNRAGSHTLNITWKFESIGA